MYDATSARGISKIIFEPIIYRQRIYSVKDEEINGCAGTLRLRHRRKARFRAARIPANPNRGCRFSVAISVSARSVPANAFAGLVARQADRDDAVPHFHFPARINFTR